MAITCPHCQSRNPETVKFCGECGTPLPSPRARTPAATETVQTPVHELATGTTFAGRYQVIEELGHGGMGRVYKVFDTEIREKIALKLIRPDIAADRPTIERFSNEIRLARRIGHRNVCRMFDIGEAEGARFITMEFVEGEDLKSLIRMSGSLSLGMLLSVGKQICEGLAEAHSLGVVHRDLKPQNIMIDKDGHAKIMDFGIARSVREKGITGPSIMVGTPEYISPEQAEARDVDHRSDIYSLGIILYEMATSRVPFEGETALSIAMKHKGEKPKDPGELNPSLPPDLGLVVLKCLEKDKGKRYQAAAEVRSELERIEKGLPTSERAIPKTRSATSKEITVTVKFRRWLIPVIAGLGVAAAFVLWRPFSHKPPDKLSIAVLPFASETAQDTRLELGDSMAEEITGRLRDLNRFPVKSNFAAARFRGTTKSLRSVGEELGVDFLITGKIRAAGEEIEVYVELTEAEGENQVWDERYRDRLSNILGIQGRIAERIASSLLKALTPGDQELLRKQPTVNTDAYRYYVEGRQAWNKRNEAGFRRAEELFRQAIAADPQYAKAYAGLADVYSMLDRVEEARNAARTALGLAPGLAEAHASLGCINLDLEFNVKSAEDEFRRALELDPDYPVAQYWYGRLMNMRGRIDEAIMHLKRSIELDPAAPMTYQNLAVAFWFSGRIDEAVVTIKKAIEMDPTQLLHRGVLYRIYVFNSRFQDLFDALKTHGESGSLEGRYWTNMAYLLMGDRDKAREYIARNERMVGGALPSFVSYFYFGMEDVDKGTVWAEKAIEARDYQILYSYSAPFMKPFHSDPRMIALWKRLGLVD